MRIVVVTLSCLLCVGSAFALTPGDCTFHAPFDGGFDASFARGSANAGVTGNLIPVY